MLRAMAQITGFRLVGSSKALCIDLYCMNCMCFNGGLSGWINSLYVATKVGAITKLGVCLRLKLQSGTEHIAIG